MDFDLNMLTSAELHAMNRNDVKPIRSVRKAIFSLRLWLPARQRAHSRSTTVDPGTSDVNRNNARADDLTFGCINAQSVGNKSATLCRAIADDHLDVLVVTETWHEDSESASLKRTVPPGYRSIDAARPFPPGAAVDSVYFQNHGGLAFIYRDCIKFQKKLFDISVSTFEYMCGLATICHHHLVLLGLYRPASQPLSSAFYDELSMVFVRLATYNCPVAVCGDFNIHVDQVEDVNAARLQQLLQSFGYVQHVSEPTHNAGHTLDLVITRSDVALTNLHVGAMISDHALIRFKLSMMKAMEVNVQTVTSRAWRRLSHDAFASDLAASRLCSNLDALSDMSVDDLAQLYRDVMTDILDRHCPVVTIRRRARPMTPWFDAECRAARRRARAAERRFRSLKRRRSDVDKRDWRTKLKAMRLLYEDKKDRYWRNEIANSKGNMQRLWRTLHSALGETSGGETGDHTADEFASFFTDKVASVRASTATTPLYDVPYKSTPQLTEWTAVTVDEVEKLIGSAPTKTCQLDPVPTWLVKHMRSLLSPFVALLFNTSLVSGRFPSEFKQAVIRPLLKLSLIHI